MANYFNFNKVTPAAPNDPLVNEAIQLNANWDQLDTKLTPYIDGTPVTPTEIGQEYFDNNGRFAVWTGTSGRVPDDIDSAWSPWTNLTVASGRVIRTGWTPRWRNNSLLRMVQLSGGYLYDSAADAWPLVTQVVLNTDASTSPPSSMAPIGGTHRSQCAAGLTTSPSLVAAGYITIDTAGGTWTHVRIQAQYLGGPGGGNFLNLDQIAWWY